MNNNKMSLKIIYFCLIIAVYIIYIPYISGHGMMLEPPNRSSLWRFYNDSPSNYDDDQNYCGGMTEQWDLFQGKCGVCGDPYNQPHPQDNENTGKYGLGKVVRQYKSGEVIDVEILLTTNHWGTFKYSLCILNDPNAPETGENCFKDLKFEDGTNVYEISHSAKHIKNRVRLPGDVVCDRCVLRWHYRVGNNWGKCDDGTYAMGCGPQETFRSCSDVGIH